MTTLVGEYGTEYRKMRDAMRNLLAKASFSARAAAGAGDGEQAFVAR